MIGLSKTGLVSTSGREFQKSISFNGIDGYVNISEATDLDIDYTDNLSICAWVYIEDTGGVSSIIIGKRRIKNFPNRNDGWGFVVDATRRLTFQMFANVAANGISVKSDISMPLNQWIFVVATYDGSGVAAGVNLYLGYSPLTTSIIQDNLDSNSISNDAFTSIGITDSDETTNSFFPFKGNICGISSYNSVLSLSEIHDIYNKGEPTNSSKLSSFSSCVGYWYLGEGDEYPIVADRSGNNNHGTMTNMSSANITRIVPEAYIQKKSWTFDGTGQRIAFGDLTELRFGQTDPFTVSFSFKLTDTGTNVVIDKTTTGNAYGWRIWIAGGHVIFYMASVGSDILRLQTVGEYSDGEWHHAVLSKDSTGLASGVNLVIDGEVSGKTINNDSLSSGVPLTEPVTIGAKQDGTNAYDGQIAYVDVYTGQLSEKEAARLYNNGKPNDYTSDNLVGYWRADDTIQGVVTDLSTSGNNGVLTDMNDADVFYDVIQRVPPKRSVFDGTASINCGTISEHNFEKTDAFSFSFCVYVNSIGSTQCIAEKLGPSNVSGWGLFVLSTGNLRLNLVSTPNTDTILANSDATVDAGKNIRCTVTYDGSNTLGGIKMYIDGEESTVSNGGGGTSITGSMLGSYDTLIGVRNSNTAYMNGGIDELVIFDHELTQDEVTTDYQLSLIRDDIRKELTGIISYWRLGDGPRDDGSVFADVQGVADGTGTNVILQGNPDPGRPFVGNNNVIYDIDFTSEPTLDISGTTGDTFSIGGETWTLSNPLASGNCYITNGTGLIFSGDQNTFSLGVRLQDIDPEGYDPINYTYEVWADCSEVVGGGAHTGGVGFVDRTNVAYSAYVGHNNNTMRELMTVIAGFVQRDIEVRTEGAMATRWIANSYDYYGLSSAMDGNNFPNDEDMAISPVLTRTNMSGSLNENRCAGVYTNNIGLTYYTVRRMQVRKIPAA